MYPEYPDPFQESVREPVKTLATFETNRLDKSI
jgi:hypothetical protein